MTLFIVAYHSLQVLMFNVHHLLFL